MNDVPEMVRDKKKFHKRTMYKLEGLLKGPHPGKTIKSGAKSLKHQRAQTDRLHTTTVILMETLSRDRRRTGCTHKLD